MTLSILTLFLSATTHAGVVIEYVKRNAATGKEEPARSMWIQNGMARIEASQAQRSIASIFKNDTLYTLDGARKSYLVMDKATIDQTATTMDAAMATMREKLASMPPEQRAAMEQMMKQRGLGGGAMTGAPQKPAVYDAEPTGAGETVNGKSCKLWNVKRDGVLTQQLCVVPLSAMPGADEVMALGKQMMALFEKFGGVMREQMAAVMQESNAAMTKINGYPIMTRAYHDGVVAEDQYIVKAWKQQAIDAAKFEIPADYTKQEIPKMSR